MIHLSSTSSGPVIQHDSFAGLEILGEYRLKSDPGCFRGKTVFSRVLPTSLLDDVPVDGVRYRWDWILGFEPRPGCSELLDAGHVDSVVLCDTDESRGRTLADNYGLEYATHHQALIDRSVDAATVATPSSTHYGIGRDLLSGDVDVLIEKPLALTAENAWDIVDCAERHHRTLAVGHIFRSHPALIELKRRIDRGELGDLKYLHTTRFAFRVPRSSAGVLHSLAVHDVDISNWLIDETPETAYCRLDSFVRDDVNEMASITLDYDGATSVINESWQVPVYGKRRDITVVGTEKVAHIDYLADNVLELYDSRVEKQEGGLHANDEGVTTVEVEDREPLKVEVKQFLEAVRSGSSASSSIPS